MILPWPTQDNVVLYCLCQGCEMSTAAMLPWHSPTRRFQGEHEESYFGIEQPGSCHGIAVQCDKHQNGWGKIYLERV